VGGAKTRRAKLCSLPVTAVEPADATSVGRTQTYMFTGAVDPIFLCGRNDMALECNHLFSPRCAFGQLKSESYVHFLALVSCIPHLEMRYCVMHTNVVVTAAADTQITTYGPAGCSGMNRASTTTKGKLSLTTQDWLPSLSCRKISKAPLQSFCPSCGWPSWKVALSRKYPSSPVWRKW